MTNVRDDREGDDRADRDELDADLAAVAVDERRCRPPGSRRGREDAGGDRAEHAADAVDREDVERVVDLAPRPQQRGAVAQPAGDEADDQCATGGHEPGRRGDRDEPGDGAARCADDADLAAVEVAAPGPR